MLPPAAVYPWGNVLIQTADVGKCRHANVIMIERGGLTFIKGLCCADRTEIAISRSVRRSTFNGGPAFKGGPQMN